MLSTVAAACLACAARTTASLLLAGTDGHNEPASLSIRNAHTSCPLGSGAESHQVAQSSGTWPWQVYESARFNPPVFDITTNGKPLANGLIFITPSDNSPAPATKEVAPLIMTDCGQLVWSGPMVNATNLRVTSFKGNDILTYWSGISSAGSNIGHGYGNVTFLDSSYNELLTVCPQLGLVTPDNTKYPCEADFHESFVTDRNTLLVTAYNATQTDLTSVGGPANGWVFDCLFYEINPETGAILFQWSALEHVPVSDTKLPLAGTGQNQSIPFDWFHINSVVNIGDEYLVNSRHLWSTYLLTATGDIIWTLQGDTGGDFGTLPADGHFAWQHYARPHQISKSSISISYFNNFNKAGDNGTHPTTGLEIKLALPPNKSQTPKVLLDLFDPAAPIYADSQGSFSFLPNQNFFQAYGQIPVMREYGPKSSGNDIRWTARFGANNLVQSYRGFKHKWSANPTTAPSLTVVGGGSDACATGYVSWNGATDVTAWQVSEGPSTNQLAIVGKVGYKGFETKFTVAQACVQVAAVVGGKVSVKSNVVCVS